MTCRTIIAGPGVTVIACTRGETKRCACGNRVTRLCDYPLRGTLEGATCSAPLCEKCAKHVGPGRDYCPAHGRLDP